MTLSPAAYSLPAIQAGKLHISTGALPPLPAVLPLPALGAPPPDELPAVLEAPATPVELPLEPTGLVPVLPAWGSTPTEPASADAPARPDPFGASSFGSAIPDTQAN